LRDGRRAGDIYCYDTGIEILDYLFCCHAIADKRHYGYDGQNGNRNTSAGLLHKSPFADWLVRLLVTRLRFSETRSYSIAYISSREVIILRRDRVQIEIAPLEQSCRSDRVACTQPLQYLLQATPKVLLIFPRLGQVRSRPPAQTRSVFCDQLIFLVKPFMIQFCVSIKAYREIVNPRLTQRWVSTVR
jgi:hypothetical protein